MHSKGSRFTLGGLGGWRCVRLTLRARSQPSAAVRNLPQPSATVRNRPQPFATVCNRLQPFATVRAIPVWPYLWEVLQEGSFLEISDMSLLRFAWQAWYFVAFRRVPERVESRFVWQAQAFSDIFRKYIAIFVAGATFWTRPSSFSVAGAIL